MRIIKAQPIADPVDQDVRRRRQDLAQPQSPAEHPAPPEQELPPGRGLQPEFPGEEDFSDMRIPPPEEIADVPPGLQEGVAPGWTPEEMNLQPDGLADFTFLPWGEDPEERQPVDPAKLFEEQIPPETPLEKANRQLTVRQKIWEALNKADPLKIQYTTLPDDRGMSVPIERVVSPDYVYWAGTNRHIMVGWDHTVDDWRAFAVDNINGADLVGEEG